MGAVIKMVDTFQKNNSDGNLDLDTDTIKCALLLYPTDLKASTTDWAATTANSLDDLVRPTTENGHVYRCSTAGTTGGSEPTWPTTGEDVADGTVVWTDAGANIDSTIEAWVDALIVWTATTAITLDDLARPTIANINGHYYKCTTAGTTGASEPTWPTGSGATVGDGTVTWTEQGVNPAACEITGTAYTEGGATLANDDVTNSGRITTYDADDITWSAATLTARIACLYKDGGTFPMLQHVLLDELNDVSVTTTDFVIQWNPIGIIQWSLGT